MFLYISQFLHPIFSQCRPRTLWLLLPWSLVIHCLLLIHDLWIPSLGFHLHQSEWLCHLFPLRKIQYLRPTGICQERVPHDIWLLLQSCIFLLHYLSWTLCLTYQLIPTLACRLEPQQFSQFLSEYLSSTQIYTCFLPANHSGFETGSQVQKHSFQLFLRPFSLVNDLSSFLFYRTSLIKIFI